MLESRTDGALEEAARPRGRRVEAAVFSRASTAAFAARGSSALAAAAVVLSVGACTAVPSLVQCRKAEAKLVALEAAAARIPSAGSSRPSLPEVSYELTLARAYLDKARQEGSEARYGVSIKLAKSSQQASARAENALARRRGRL